MTNYTVDTLHLGAFTKTITGNIESQCTNSARLISIIIL